MAKVLSVAPAVKKVFLLIRGRRGKTAQYRFERDVLTTELFEDMLKQNPALKEKFVVRLPLNLSFLSAGGLVVL